MSQNYLWKVSYSYRTGLLSGWQHKSRVFTNKVEAMKFANQMENSKHARGVRFSKWHG